MKTVTLVFGAIALLLSAAFLGHAIVTGIAVPYPDPTPEQYAYEHHHEEISTSLFSAAVVSWVATSVIITARLVHLVLRGGAAKKPDAH